MHNNISLQLSLRVTAVPENRLGHYYKVQILFARHDQLHSSLESYLKHSACNGIDFIGTEYLPANKLNIHDEIHIIDVQYCINKTMFSKG